MRPTILCAFACALLAAALPVCADPAAAQEKVPAAGLLPATEDFRLPNGMRVILLADHEAPLVSVDARVVGGSVEDEPGKAGATDLLATLLAKGAGDRGSAEFHEAVDFVGGSFGTGAGRRWISVAAEFLKKDADLELELVSDALRRPLLPASEFEKERALAIDGIRQSKQDPRDIIRLYHAHTFFGAHPFAKPSGGDETSLAALTLDDVKAVAARTLGPSRTWLAVAGDFEPSAMRRKIEARFGDWSAQVADPAPVPKLERPAGKVLLVDAPQSLQTYFRFGQLGFDWSDPDYPARDVADTILGGLFTSRLNKALRIDSGLTYGASSRFDDWTQGTFFVASYAEVAKGEEAMQMAFDVTSKFLAGGITQAEFDASRAYIKGQFAPGTIETAAQAASQILDLEIAGLPRDVVGKLLARIDALTLADVNRVIRERYPSKDWVWTVVGPADKLRESMAKRGPVTECKLADPGFGP